MSSTQCAKNKVLLAAAGSRKTSWLVREAESRTPGSVLVVTYTQNNTDLIRQYFIRRSGCIPRHVTVTTWYSFLFSHGVRPYQRCVIRSQDSAENIVMTPLPDYMRRIRKANARAYYLTKDRKIYRDRVAEFVCDANTRSNGAVIRRLERIYPRLLIDEVQDLCGYDLELLDQLFCSRIRVVAVGDLRQANLRTNLGRKNRRYRGAGLLDWLQERTEYIAVEERTCSYRSNQAICDFADRLFSTLPRTTSANTHVTGHDGVFLVPRSVVHAYASRFRPMVLRHDRTVDTLGLHAQNIGVSKGKTYERVLIFPTKMVQEYLRTGDIRRAGDKTNLYVAVTRAQYSVAFVVDDADVDPMEHAGLAIRWQP